MIKITGRPRFLLRVLAIVAVLTGARFAAHEIGWEPITLNALFTGIIAANVFLMGFLLSGVLADYKESEKLPGELSACLENMAQEVVGIGLSKPEAETGPALAAISRVASDIMDWFYKRAETAHVLDSLDELTVQFAAIEKWTQATFIARLKTEQSALRRTFVRIETIRDTSFVSSAYLLADMITSALCLGLILVNMAPVHFLETLLTTSVISFLLVFLILLIRDLDNPFGYYEEYSGADVTLKPFESTVVRLAKLAGKG
jgi:hypothetical protein